MPCYYVYFYTGTLDIEVVSMAMTAVIYLARCKSARLFFKPFRKR